MKTNRFYLVIGFLFGISTFTSAQTESQIITAWEQENYATLLQCHATADSSLLPMIEDALVLVKPNLEKLSYDQLDSLRVQCTDDSLALNLLIPAYNASKRQIIAQLYSLNSEEVLEYLQRHPSHKNVLYGTFEECVYESLPSISLPELIMLNKAFPEMQPVKETMSGRGKELKDLMKDNIQNFTQNEAYSLYRLQYVITRKAHAYLYARYENICYQYAAIENIPDDPSALEKQFAGIVKQNLSSDDLRNYLQLEVNAYCDAVNAGRAELCKVMGLKQYTPMKITVPQIKIGYKSDKTILERIPQAKADYADNRENINEAANIAGWFTSGLMGRLLVKGGKMMADRWAGSNLADKIIYARLAYLESCYLSLSQNMERQIRIVENDVNEQMNNNEKKFVEYVKNK